MQHVSPCDRIGRERGTETAVSEAHACGAFEELLDGVEEE